jgi:glycosyltransferase involved in cell wall biosynthesis
MRVGIVFHKDPFSPPSSIDLIRLRAITGGLIRRGIRAEIVSPVKKEGLLDEFIPVYGLSALSQSGRYDLIKTCYHQSIMLVDEYRGPIVARIVRVVDRELPERDAQFRDELLHSQQIIRSRAAAVILNNTENQKRWSALYGDDPPTILVPTGCSAEIPPPSKNPFQHGERAILFLGSVAAPRMMQILNTAAKALAGVARFHLVGLNKACMYGGDEACRLDPAVIDHGELPETETWDYIRNAEIGLALATGPHPFDNDVSKVLNYLRGGLPVLSEGPILNNDLIRKTGLGRIFRYGDVDDLVAAARDLLENPPDDKREAAMRLVIEEHSWDKRAEVHANLFKRILSDRHIDLKL